MAEGEHRRAAVKLRTAWMLLRDGGARSVFSATLGRCGMVVFDVFDTPVSTMPSSGGPDGITFGWLTFDEAEAYIRHDRQQTTPTSAIERLLRGDRCFVAKKDNEIASSRWHAFGLLSEDVFPFVFGLDRNEAYVYGVYTNESYRGRGLASFVSINANNDLAIGGIVNLVSVIYQNNTPGVRTAVAAGGKRAGMLVTRGRFGLLLRSGKPPKVSLGGWHSENGGKAGTVHAGRWG